MELDHLAALRPNYLRRLGERTHLLQDFLSAGMVAGQDWAGMHRLAHSMASSASIYGYKELSAAARAAEMVLSKPATDRFASEQALETLLNRARMVLSNENLLPG